MTPTDIFRDYLLLEKDVSLELQSKEAATYILRLLRTAKGRHCKDMAALGLDDVDPVAGKTIGMEVVSETPNSCKVRYFLSEEVKRKMKVEFRVLGVDEVDYGKT